MGRLRSRGLQMMAAVLPLLSLLGISACGGHHITGQSPFTAKILLTPSINLSIAQGAAFAFIASAQNSSGTAVAATFTYTSSDTSILNISSNGVACAGHFDSTFTSCIAGGSGMVTVTASANGTSSSPTYVFVHPPIDNIKVTGILADGIPIQEPCLSQGQAMTIQAQAYSHGVDITQSVGPFTWTAKNPSVVNLVPQVTSNTLNFPTNQATAFALMPGFTQIYASASGVFSNVFVQPQPYHGAQLNFFETCPIQTITLEIGPPGSQQTGQTSFIGAKGESQTVTAVLTDVMGNSSINSGTNGVVLSKIPLTWSASQPAVMAPGASCLESCSITTPLPGAGSVTASCTPPTCNVGFPEIPAGVSAPFIPMPVYATTAISGIITGDNTAGGSVVATTLDCAHELPATCQTGLFDISTAKAAAGNAIPFPNPPNSFLFDLAGDKAYVGSDFGALSVNAANLGGSNSAFSSLGAVTGKVLASSPTGLEGIFSDTIHTPNQVFITGAFSSSALNIYNASVAGFSQDGLKAYIFGTDAGGNPTLYIYSSTQALQTIPLPAGTTVSSIAFSTNGAFAYVVEPELGGVGPAVSVYNTCDNEPITDSITGLHYVPLAAAPIAFKALPDGVHFMALESGGTLEYITAKITGLMPATLAKPATSICPMAVGHMPSQFIDLHQGTIDPINFWVAADNSQIYIAARDRSSILIYNFNSGAVSGIELAGNVVPVSIDASPDGGTFFIAGSDGLLHEVTTTLGGSDSVQVAFPNLPNYLNPFCTFTPAQGPCLFDLAVARP